MARIVASKPENPDSFLDDEDSSANNPLTPERILECLEQYHSRATDKAKELSWLICQPVDTRGIRLNQSFLGVCNSENLSPLSQFAHFLQRP